MRRLSHTAVSESGAAWWRTRVAFTAKVNGKRALWIANAADGSNAKPIASDPQWDFYNPSWSADGTRLTFYSDAGDHKDQIWTVNPDGTNLRRVTDGRFHNTFPSWSPKGNRLLYTQETEASEKRTGQLISIAADGSDAQVLATDSVFLGIWSPKGNRIAYTRFDSTNVGAGFQTELVIVDADGKNRRVIHH
ncbi:MAG: hypothetical protein ABIQ43_09455 [Sphingomonas sp.]